MCRLLGIFSENQFELKESREIVEEFVEIAKRDRTLGHTHGDGWGLAWIKNNQYGLYKEVKPIWESNIPDDVASFSYILHARKASMGSIVIENTHPFQMEDILLAHNGHINQKLTAVKHRPIGTTDSENFLAMLMDLREHYHNTEEALFEAIEKIGDDFYALNLIVGSLKEKMFWILNYYNDIDVQHTIHYSLRYKVEDDKLIIASEPLGGENWNVLSDKPLYPILMRVPFEDPLEYDVIPLKVPPAMIKNG